jgi:hypothetical protein
MDAPTGREDATCAGGARGVTVGNSLQSPRMPLRRLRVTAWVRSRAFNFIVCHRARNPSPRS